MKMHRSTKRKLRITLFIVFVVAAIGAAYYWYLGQTDQTKIPERTPAQSTNYGAPSQSEINAGEQAKLKTVENDQKAKSEKTGGTPSPASFSTDISAGVNAGTLQIRNDISGIYNKGTCTLTLTKGNVTKTKTTVVQALPQSSTCKGGFDIPVSELTPGTWQIHLSVTINGEIAKASSSVIIQ